MPDYLRETKGPKGTRREIHRLMKGMNTSGWVVRYKGRDWMIYMPYENRLAHAGSLNFIIKVLRKKYPDMLINGRFLEHRENGHLPKLGGVYSVV